MSYRCPAVEPGEAGLTRRGKARLDERIAYGFYPPYATEFRANIDDPDETILVAETSDHGALGSYDPRPFKGVSDAFALGWDDSNVAPQSPATTKSITRLAFRDGAKGPYGPDATPRHQAGIHAVTVSGRKLLLGPGDSFVQWGLRNLVGRWRSPYVEPTKSSAP